MRKGRRAWALVLTRAPVSCAPSARVILGRFFRTLRLAARRSRPRAAAPPPQGLYRPRRPTCAARPASASRPSLTALRNRWQFAPAPAPPGLNVQSISAATNPGSRAPGTVPRPPAGRPSGLCQSNSSARSRVIGGSVRHSVPVLVIGRTVADRGHAGPGTSRASGTGPRSGGPARPPTRIGSITSPLARAAVGHRSRWREDRRPFPRSPLARAEASRVSITMPHVAMPAGWLRSRRQPRPPIERPVAFLCPAIPSPRADRSPARLAHLDHLDLLLGFPNRMDSMRRWCAFSSSSACRRRRSILVGMVLLLVDPRRDFAPDHAEHRAAEEGQDCRDHGSHPLVRSNCYGGSPAWPARRCAARPR